MNSRLTSTLCSLFLSILLFIVLEVTSTALIPALGFESFILPFNVLFILFFAFQPNTPSLPVFILLIQVCHSIFSVEGWGIGTLGGVAVAIGVNYLKSIIDLSTTISTIIVTLIAVLSWYIITSFFIYLSAESLDIALHRLWNSLPECVVISLLSPIFFAIVGRIWRVNLINRVDA